MLGPAASSELNPVTRLLARLVGLPGHQGSDAHRVDPARWLELVNENQLGPFIGGHLLGLGRPQDIANGVYYLASDAARWITGIELSIDGGNVAA